MSNPGLTELVVKAQQGDKKALNDLLSSCYGDIYYYVLKNVKNEDLAADVTQESFLEIMATLDKLREPAAFPLWARRIAYHKSALHFRAAKEVLPIENEDGESILDSLPDDSEDSLPEKAMEDKIFRQTIMDMINSLPPEQTSALLLYYYDKLSVKEIAEIQGVTEGTVKSRLNYARKAIKKKIEDYEEKNGTRLHGFAAMPLLLRLFFEGEKAAIPAAFPASLAASAAAAGSGASAAATSATAAAAGANASSAATAAAAATAKTAGALLAGKIAAGTVAAALLTVGAAVGISKSAQKAPEPDEAIVSPSDTESPLDAKLPFDTASDAVSSDHAPEHIHAWIDATCTAPKTCSECGETEGDPPGHTLTAATYFAPATCAVCGVTEGGPKQSYFEELGIPVADAPTDYIHKGAIADENDMSYFIEKDFPTKILERTVEPDEREGYNKVTFAIAVQGELVWRDENGHAGYGLAGVSFDLFDLYSGLRFRGDDSHGSVSEEYAMNLSLDGVGYEITYTLDSSSHFGEWIETDDNAKCSVTFTHRYVIHVPEGYDGLVYCAEGGTDLLVDDTGGDGENPFYAGQLERLGESLFFRLNKQ